jgi:predicted secreted protein
MYVNEREKLFNITLQNSDCIAIQHLTVAVGYSTISKIRTNNDECNSDGSGSRTLGYKVSSTGNVYTTFTSDASQSTSELGFKMYMISGKDLCEYIYIDEEDRRLSCFLVPK